MDPFLLFVSSVAILVGGVLPIITLRGSSNRKKRDDQHVDESPGTSGDGTSSTLDSVYPAESGQAGPPFLGDVSISTNQASSVTWTNLHGPLEINQAALTSQASELLTPSVCEMLVTLHHATWKIRKRLLHARNLRQKLYDHGHVPDYLAESELPEARKDWQIAELPNDLLDRRVEITGPAHDAKLVINMLSRAADGDRADAAMLDMEDSMKPSWDNVVAAVANIRDAANGMLTYVRPASGKSPEKRYTLDLQDMPLMMVRPRGLHLDEVNVRINGESISASLFDFVLSACYSAEQLLKRGSTPKYYIPKIEHHLEARWFDRLFTLTEKELGLAVGTLRMTLLIETLPAAFQMEEILYETRRHAAGLNGGRWDKIFSDIKIFRERPDRVMADRATIGMDRPWMKNYALQLIRTCHKHGAFAMGGMAAFTPGRDEARRSEQLEKVVSDKRFEASIGHDGCWVSHPYFIGPARKPFKRQNQLDVIPTIDERVDLLPRGSEPRTLDGLRKNIRVGIVYMRGWNADIGCVAWDDLMEDLATLEISRSQTWQWIRHGIILDSGEQVTRFFVEQLFTEELERILREVRDELGPMDADELDPILESYRNAATDACALYTETAFRPFLTQQSDGAHVSLDVRRTSLRTRH